MVEEGQKLAFHTLGASGPGLDVPEGPLEGKPPTAEDSLGPLGWSGLTAGSRAGPVFPPRMGEGGRGNLAAQSWGLLLHTVLPS